MQAIDDQAKNISTLEKSKKDWNEFTEKANMKEDLKRKRMDGYLSKSLFLEQAQINERNANKKKNIDKLPI